MKTPPVLAAPPIDPSVGDLVRWVRPGVWQVTSLEGHGWVRLTPADYTSGNLVGFHGDGDGRPATIRTETRYLRAMEG